MKFLPRKRVRSIFGMCLSTLIVTLAARMQADAADIYNNWNAQSYQILATSTNQIAQSFRTGSSGIVLDSVSVMLNNQFPIGFNYSLHLYSSSVSNTPLTELQNLGTKSLPAFFDSTSGTSLPQGDISFAGIGYGLAANTQYFIVMRTNGLINWKGPNTDPSSLATPPVTYYSLESPDGTTWNVSGTATKPLAMVVTGTPVPEPSTLILATMAASVTILARRTRMRKRNAG